MTKNTSPKAALSPVKKSPTKKKKKNDLPKGIWINNGVYAINYTDEFGKRQRESTGNSVDPNPIINQRYIDIADALVKRRRADVQARKNPVLGALSQTIVGQTQTYAEFLTDPVTGYYNHISSLTSYQECTYVLNRFAGIGDIYGENGTSPGRGYPQLNLYNLTKRPYK